MATILLKYDARNNTARKALDFILSLKIFEVEEHKTELQKAIEEVEAGKTTKCKDFSDFVRKINS